MLDPLGHSRGLSGLIVDPLSRGPVDPMDPFGRGFDAFLVPKQRLVESVVGTFRSFGLLDAFGMSTAAMLGFVRQVCALYNDDLKFHNFHHAFTVFAVSAEVVRAVLADVTPRSGGRPALPPLQPVHVLAILIAALCHDVDHPGLSNKFLLSTREPSEVAGGVVRGASAGAEGAAGAVSGAVSRAAHPLAALHGGRTVSVVEAHHAATTARLLSQPLPGAAGDTADEGGGVPGGVNEPRTSTPASTSASSGSAGLLDAMSPADAAYVMRLITHAIMG